MALFTDGNVATLSDLRAYETSIFDVCSSEGIEPGAKLALAHREIGFELLAFLLRQGYSSARYRGLNNVLVTEPLLHTEVIWTLALIYRDAYNSQLNDRYQGKWKQYSDLSRRALRQYFDIGVGVTSAPVAKPSTPAVELLPGGNRPAVTYSICVAACGMSGYSGALSEPLMLEAREGMTLRVTLGGSRPENSVGWILYVGENDQVPARQNNVPLADGAVWICPDTGVITDLPALKEQVPEHYVMQRQQLLRG